MSPVTTPPPHPTAMSQTILSVSQSANQSIACSHELLPRAYCMQTNKSVPKPRLIKFPQNQVPYIAILLSVLGYRYFLYNPSPTTFCILHVPFTLFMG